MFLSRLIIFAVPLLLSAADSPLRFNRIFGGSGVDSVSAIATDPSGFVIAAGSTSSYDFPVTDRSRNTATHFSSSSDGGASWAPVSSLPTGRPLALAIDTSTPPVWYGVSSTGVFKSSDDGATWTETGPHDISGLTINPADPSILYARSATGLLKSTDAGSTWFRLRQPVENPNPPSYLVLDPFHPGHVFTAIANRNFRSFDGGLTWTEYTSPAPHPGDYCGSSVVFDQALPGAVYLSDHCDLFRSADGGLSWEVLNTPFPRGAAHAVTHPARAGNLYVAMSQGLYVTYDAGNSWTLLLTYDSGNAPHALALDPAHPQTILTSTARSLDGGATWMPLGLGRDVDDFVFDRAHAGRAIASTTGAAAGWVARFDSAGTILASTYLGGQGGASIAAAATDADGNIYVTGSTSSFDFPITAAAYQTTKSGFGADTFTAKLDHNLKLVYSTFLPGIIRPASIAVDSAGSAVVAGATVPYPVQCSVIKLSPDGAGAVFATQFGDSGDTCSAATVDSAGNTVVAGSNVIAGSNMDAFVVRLDPTGSLVSSTRFGGSQRESVTSIAVDAAGNTYVAGNTASTDFPVTGGAYQTKPGSSCAYVSGGGGFIGPSVGIPYTQSAFIAKLDAAGNPVYSTYLGAGCESVRGIAVDADGNLWIAGQTSSNRFPQVMAFESGPAAGGAKPFAAMLRADGGALDFSSYFTGAGVVAVDAFGNTWLGGSAGGHASLAKVQTQLPAPLAIRTIGNAFGVRNGPVSPGQITLITADGLVPDAPADLTLTPPGTVPRTIAGTQVLFDGEAAGLVSVTRGRAIAVAPYDLAGKRQTSVQVLSNGVLSPPMLADVHADHAYLTVDGSGAGRAFAHNPDGSVNSPDNPAPQGSYVTVYVTGIGAADPACGEDAVATSVTELANSGWASIPGYLCGIFQISFLTAHTAGSVGIGDTGLTVAVK